MTDQKETKKVGPGEIINHFAKVIVACLIMMWGVINIVHNVLGWRAMEGESSSWWVTLIGVGLTGLIPLAIGIKLLSKATLKS